MFLLGLFVAGGVGACARYLIDGFVLDHTSGELPVGTFVINVTGSLLLGFLTGLVLYHAFPATPKIELGTGFCGGYTTFSTFAYETIRLAEERQTSAALRVLAASLIVPALAAALGLALAGL
jgi:fluoride exporter